MNDVYYSDKGKKIYLDKEIGRGGEGPVFSIHGNPSDCAKIYFKEKITPEHHSKLIAMVKNPPSDPCYNPKNNQIHRSIAWPSSILYADQGNTQFSGFVMPKLDMKIFSKALLYINPEDRRRKYFGGITWRHLLVVARNISSAIAAIHERGYCVGDINESNVLIASDALITLIDCDSFQVKDDSSNKVYLCLVGKEEYSAPELIGKSYKDIDRTFDTDTFALSVLIFQLLMEGFHPFSGKWQFSGEAPQIPYKIQKGMFPYGRNLKEIIPHADAPSYEIIHPEIQRLFYRCFVDGHSNPKERPTAKEWMDILSRSIGGFKKCSKNDNHFYLNHLNYCPWCAKNNKFGEDKDSFPSHVGLQVPLGDPTKSIQTIEERIDYLRTYIDMALSDGIITADEKEYIIEMGLKLQLPKKEIEKVITGEVKKYGSQTSYISTAGTPKLEISKTNFIFSNMRKGAVVSDSFTISNVGGGILSGPIKTNKKWLKVSQNNIDTTKHKQDIAFNVNTSGLAFGFRDTGTIEILSNGGTESVNVTLSIEPNIVARKRRNKYIGLGVGLSVLIFIIVANITNNKDKRNIKIAKEYTTGKSSLDKSSTDLRSVNWVFGFSADLEQIKAAEKRNINQSLGEEYAVIKLNVSQKELSFNYLVNRKTIRKANLKKKPDGWYEGVVDKEKTRKLRIWLTDDKNVPGNYVGYIQDWDARYPDKKYPKVTAYLIKKNSFTKYSITPFKTITKPKGEQTVNSNDIVQEVPTDTLVTEANLQQASSTKNMSIQPIYNRMIEERPVKISKSRETTHYSKSYSFGRKDKDDEKREEKNTKVESKKSKQTKKGNKSNNKKKKKTKKKKKKKKK